MPRKIAQQPKQPAEAASKVAPARRGRPPNQERREALLRHALQFFVAQGYRETTMEALAESFGASKTTLYRRYGSKAGLLKAVMSFETPYISEKLSHVPTKSPKTPKSVLKAFGKVLRDYHLSATTRALWLVLAQARDEQESLPGALPSAQIESLKPISDYLSELHQMGVVDAPDPDALTICFAAMISGGMSAFFGDPVKHPELLPSVEVCVGVFLGGIRRTK